MFCSRLHLDDDSLKHDAFPSATESILANGSDRLGRCKYVLISIGKIADVCKVSGATGFVQNYAGLVALRFLCGVTEAPYFVGAIFFLSSWYTKTELPFRIAIFYLGYTLASAFGGLIAAGILDGMDGLGGYQSWVHSDLSQQGFYILANALSHNSDGCSLSRVQSPWCWASLPTLSCPTIQATQSG
jgi:MFS family permease